MKAFEVSRYYQQYFQTLQDCTADETRMFIHYIYHDEENKVLVATTGRNMFIWDIPDAEMLKPLREFLAGVKFLRYSKGILYAVDFDGNFPEWKRVVPNVEKASCYEPIPLKLTNKANRLGAMRLMATLFYHGLYVNYDNIEPIKSLEFREVYITGKDTAVLATAPGMRFVVMPMAQER